MINDTIFNDVANHICDAYDNLLLSLGNFKYSTEL